MQGRLSPPVGDRIQAFPTGVWQEEFGLCRELGLGCLEWVYEYQDVLANPLSSQAGAREIFRMAKSADVQVSSVVADYFMTQKLFGECMCEVEKATNVLEKLIRQCVVAQIPLLELPFVDQSALLTEKDRVDVVKNILPVLINYNNCGVRIAFETSLEPTLFKEFIESFSPVRVFVNYDMGNSAASGFNPLDEFKLLGSHITNVHIKDRVYMGGTVPLGEGDTDFDLVFSELKRINYQGDYVLQAARQDLSSDFRESSYKKTVLSYIEFISPYLA